MMRENQSGFTIVEIITGILVMTIFVIGISITMNNLTYINDSAYDQVLINGLVENKVESLRSATFGALTDGTFDFSDELATSIGAPKSAQYTITTSTDPLVGTALKQIDVVISYTVGRTSQTSEFTTYISELGIGQ